MNAADVNALLRLLERIVHEQTEIVSITDVDVADWHEILRTSPRCPFADSEAKRLAIFMESIQGQLYHLGVLSDGLTLDRQPPIRLTQREFRLFRVDRVAGELMVRQVSRLRASVLLSRMQIRGMLTEDLRPAGPNRANLEALVTAPFS